jgi:pyrroloquinoline quinone biosynthesis protein D
MIDRRARPRLADHVRARADRATGRTWLLSPERGLLLSTSAASVVALCTGEREVADIAARLGAEHGVAPAVIERDVLDLLRALDDRGLLREGRR